MIILKQTVTVMSPEGKPIQINANALQATAAQNVVGRCFDIKQTLIIVCTQKLSLISKGKFSTIQRTNILRSKKNI